VSICIKCRRKHDPAHRLALMEAHLIRTPLDQDRAKRMKNLISEQGLCWDCAFKLVKQEEAGYAELHDRNRGLGK